MLDIMHTNARPAPSERHRQLPKKTRNTRDSITSIMRNKLFRDEQASKPTEFFQPSRQSSVGICHDHVQTSPSTGVCSLHTPDRRSAAQLSEELFRQMQPGE